MPKAYNAQNLGCTVQTTTLMHACMSRWSRNHQLLRESAFSN
ncbi:hypothetical protein TGAM01_v203952 [Trichoderma gamsii]|uniref:Uncharacterized protein n=1 Tax=Trichoderma gamsii TaxID=398673 RepID=A0A2P4ZRX1_9HYPO|nr:hypothetical protein TGAM01_v203952 [Trichoderma gamsii]PON27003.1 hypothetical protein TGAM01_v203952 [Trichoderma gamsii]